jgi:hypothetical protein
MVGVAKGMEIGDVLREKITYGSLFCYYSQLSCKRGRDTTDIHIRRRGFNNTSVEGMWSGGGAIDACGWGEIHINRKFCLFLWAAHSQNSK